jgi:hypothetical protein
VSYTALSDGGSAAIALTQGWVIKTTGSGLATLGPGPMKGQTRSLEGNATVGPFDYAVSVYLTGRQSLSYEAADSAAYALALQTLAPGAGSIPFATAVPFTTRFAYMAQQTVSSVLAFTVNSAGAAEGASCTVDLIADGTNFPTFTGFREWDGSSGYVNSLNVRNCVTFFVRGGIYYYSINQQSGAAADQVAATAVTMSGPTSGTVSVASSNFTVGANGTITGTVTVTPAATGGGTFSPTSVAISSGTPTATFSYTPASTGAKTISVTNNGGLSNPSSIAFTSNAAGYSLLAHGSGVQTTAAINTTGADFIVVGIAADVGRTLSDNKGNTWTALTASSSAGPGLSTAKLFYCKSPTVGTGHTFTASIGYATVFAAAFSGSGATPFSAEIGNTTASATSLAAGSITPAQNNSLVIALLTEGPTLASPAISTGFTVSDSIAGVSGTAYGGVLVYELQSTATARNATWTWATGAEEAATRVAVFK